jgi:hypothetical protein
MGVSQAAAGLLDSGRSIIPIRMGNTSNNDCRSVTVRKNVAGQVVAFQAVSTTDGSAVTTGTPAVYYTIDGGTQGTGAGTSTHEGNGCWSYAPAQAETNGNHVVFTFALTGAVSQSVNLYPVAFDPTDSVRIGLAALPNAAAGAAGGLPTDSTGKTAFNDLDATGVRSAVGLASANLDTQLADLPTVSEFEARTLVAAAYFDPAADTVANVTTVGSVTGSVGSISGVSFPANFGSLLINVSGHISRVVLVDTTTANSDMRGTDSAALASEWTATRAGYLDGVLLADNFNQRTVQVTGSNHIAADVHEFQPDVLTSAATAASFVAEVQAGLATSTALTVVDGIVDKLLSRSGYTMSILAGAISNAQNAAEAYTITLDGTAYGVTYSGLDSSGNRTGATLTET